MKKKIWDNEYNVKTVSAKLSSLEFSKFKGYCEQKGLKPSTQIKNLIKDEIDHPIPNMISGKNVFTYSKVKDNFNWSVMLDNGLRVDIEDNLSTEFVSQLYDELKRIIDERNTYIKRESKESVSIPSKIVRKKL